MYREFLEILLRKVAMKAGKVGLSDAHYEDGHFDCEFDLGHPKQLLR